MSSVSQRIVPWALCALAACTAANAAEVGSEPGRSSPSAAAAAPVGAQTAGARGVFYDLAKHRDHAELRLGKTLLIDLGTPAAAKYTLGGWNTHVRSDVQLDGVSAALVSGSFADVIVPLVEPGPRVIRVRARAARDGSLVAYLGERVVGRFKSKPDAFSVFEIEVPETFERGEHLLRLRGSGIGRMGTHESALALDWITIGEGAPMPDSLPVPTGSAGSLTLPQGLSLGFGLRMPASARLTATLQGAGARLAVFATDDSLRRTALGEFGEGKLDLDLSALEGRTLRLELEARSPLSLQAPQLTAPAAASRQPIKPIKNVLVYLIDTLRADHLKAFNSETRVRTPGLDQLVQQGSAVFASAHTQENWTKPSVATLLSSLFPWEHRATTTEAVVPAAVELLPERLGKLGYFTGAFIANGYVSDKFGFKQGWSTYRNYIREGRYSRAEFLAADVLEWLDKRPSDKPFMLYVHAIDPHVPYKPTAQFLSIYDPLPYDGVVDFKNDNELLEKIKIGRIKLKERDKQRLEALYDSEISYHDLHFRTIVAALEKRGLAEDTMVVVVADHGEEFWDHGSVGHGHSVYEELLRIPMVIRVPGVTQTATKVASAAGLVDIVPTVFDALGQQQPEGLSGRSLLPELRGATADAPPVSVSGFMDGWRTLVMSDLKLIQRTEKRFMLHDLRTDPHEQQDVAKERPITVRTLRAQLGLALARSQSEASRGRMPKPETTRIDAETEAQLRALGYVGSSRR